MDKSKELIHKPYNKFKGVIREKGLTYNDISKLLGVTPSTISMKINGYSDFYISEINILSEKCGICHEFFL